MAERYANWHPIGEGASAVVYRATDQELGCEVAIKLLKPDYCKHQHLVDSLRKEVLISRSLRHPNICAIHDLYEGVVEGERRVGIVMDLISGQELRKWLAENRGRLLDTLPQRLTLFRRLTEALNEAHKRIIHRDLKPDNIFLRDKDIEQPVIMDFGIAVAGSAEGEQWIAGTPKYMAPEQVVAISRVDQRSDLFALGIMGYEIFTEQIPPTSLKDVFKTRPPQPPPRVPLSQIRPPSSFCPLLPEALDRVILQLMAYDQADRPQSAAEVLAALAQVELRELDVAEMGGAEAAGATLPEPITIEGGTIYIGSGPESANANEKPRRKVVLSPFRIDPHPVTNRAYRAFLDATGYRRPPLIDDPLFGRDDHPVVAVTWEEATAYARWVGGMLPSEAQWECAAKGGAKFVAYPWGEEPPTATRANIDGASDTTSAVTACPAGRNPFGLYDMCGNVWEWCRDDWSEGYYGGLGNGAQDPVNEADGTLKSLRGGAFDSFAGMGRCAFRYFAPATEARRSVGFRVVYPA